MWSHRSTQQIRWGIASGTALLLGIALLSSRQVATGAPPAAVATPTFSDLAPDQHKGSPSGTPVYQYPPGMPAIAVKTTSGPGPNFTAADVAAFVARYTMSNHTPDGAPTTLVSVEFLTSAVVHQKLNTDTARPPEALMCVAYVHGDFTISSGISGASAGHSTEGWLLFDAVTGNLLVEAS